MRTKAATTNGVSERDAKYVTEIDKCLVELTAIRREMKETDAEIRRLEVSTGRKLNQIRANLHVETAA